MSKDTWQSSYAFHYRGAAKILEEVLGQMGLAFSHSQVENGDDFDAEGGAYTIRLYHDRYRMRTGFGFPGWLKPEDISDIMISPIDQSLYPKISSMLSKFVDRSPVKPWDFGLKVKAHSVGIAGRTRKRWEKYLGKAGVGV